MSTTNDSNDSNEKNNEDILAAQRDKAKFVFRESVAPGLNTEMALKRILETRQSQYQDISVIETYFGRTLITDGKTQSAEFDEFAYHESLVHPAMLNFNHCSDTGKVNKVFIGGGGELATAREVLRHASVERLVMVDLDEAVIDVCVQHLPEWGGEAVKNDDRFHLIVGDAYDYLLNTDEIFDIIIMDISDPIEAGPGIMLYTKELYEHAKTRLSPHGVFVTQAGAGDAIPPPHSIGDTKQQDTTCFGPIRNTLATVFDCVLPYTMSIPSFGSDWGFVMAYNGHDAAWGTVPHATLDQLIDDAMHDELRMYDGITHTRMFALTKPVRKQLRDDTRIMTKDNPVFMY